MADDKKSADLEQQGSGSETHSSSPEHVSSSADEPQKNDGSEEKEISPDSDNAICYVVPQKKIKGPFDIVKWEKSQAYSDYMGFVNLLNKAVMGKKISDKFEVSKACLCLLKVLETVDSWIDQIPPEEQPQRFGNRAFSRWHRRLLENSEELIKSCLPHSHLEPAIVELKEYLNDGFGNASRIDYGTGHELAFAAFLCSFFKLRILTFEDDAVAVVLKIFARYLVVTRRLQITYRMEPAGSQGVWGLDDFQFLPFIWGSAQLIGHPRINPKSFVDSEVVEGFHKDFLFLGCIKFIESMKTGPFAEHSNTLWGISGVPNWAKVNGGLIKMYKAEVLSKYPVIQHFPFGTLMSFEPASV